MDFIQNKKADLLVADFTTQPLLKSCPMVLELLNEKSAMVSMAVLPEHCVKDGDGRQMVQGGIIATVVDFAGVYLARMQADPKFITPLSELNEIFLRPVILGTDNKIFAVATLVCVIGSRIIVDVRVENEVKKLKGVARLIFAMRSS